MRRWVVVMAAAVATAMAGCDPQLVCPAGQRACNGTCAEVALDPSNCGGCGVACAAGEACSAGACTDCASACGDGQTCRDGVCRADLYVACFATDEVRGVTAALAPSGPARAVDDGPVALAWSGGRIWASHALPPATVVGIEPNVVLERRFTLGGGDLEDLAAANGLVLVSDALVSTLVVIDPSLGVVDEIPLAPAAGVASNPAGIAVVGSTAVVALYGPFSPAFGQGQEIALVDVGPSATCAVPPCGGVTRRVSLEVPRTATETGAYDPPGFPFPSRVAAAGTRAFVTLSNLEEECGPYGCFFTKPAGNGRLAVVDTASGAAPTFVDLGAGCTNPGHLAASGTTLWVSCGGSGAVVPVDVGGAVPVVGTPVSLTVVPGAVAVCGGRVYVTDQYSGAVSTFAASGGTVATSAICTGGEFFDWAADVACAEEAP
jgi:hypothetical protein